MAIIYSYPSKGSVASGDLFVISDASDNNKTKQVTAQDIANFVDGEVTLQEVLDTGNRASSNGGGISTILLQDSTPNTTITLDGSAGDITASGRLNVNGVSTLATVNIDGGNIDGTIIGANTVADGSFDTMTADTVNINGGNIDGTVIGASSSAASTFTSMAASTVNIDGGTIDSTLIGSSLASEAKFSTLGTNSAVQVVGNLTGAAALRVFQGPIQFGNTGGVGYGNVGDVIISNGSAGTPEWVAQNTLSVENLVETVANNTTSLIAKGTPLHIAANPSGVPRVEPADARIPSTMPASGVALADIPAGINQPGEMLIIGQLESLNTVAYNEGDILYVADGGGLSTKPTNFDRAVQNIGIVTKSAASGAIQITATGRSNDLPNNNPNSLFSANASGFPVSTTGKLEVDVANNEILVGDATGVTDVTVNSNNFRGEVKNDTAAGVENLQIGYQSLEQAMINGGTARSNVAVGIRAMQGNAAFASAAGGSYNVAVGNDTLNSNQNLFSNVTGNTAIGHQALQGGPTNIADYNTAIGYQALINLAGIAIGTADNNTAVGASALFNVTSGGENTSIGVGSGQAITSGTKNTFLGHNSGTTVGVLTEATAVGQNADVQANGGTALGQDSIVQAQGSIALGKGAVAANPNTININVANINGVQPNGGLFVTNTGTPPAGLTPGDVYVLDAAAATNTTGHNLLCIMP